MARRARVHSRPRVHAPGTWRGRVSFRPEPGGAAGAGPRRPESAEHVLLVDDERAVRIVCRVNLEADGMTVTEAADGEEALELVRSERPSLVLLDVMMPRVDGWTTAERLHEEPETRDIPVVFISARTTPEDRVRAQKLGAVGYVVKPFDPVGLGGLVREVLERIRLGEREQLNCELAEPE